jgi:protein-tyrosine phosphatase
MELYTILTRPFAYKEYFELDLVVPNLYITNVYTAKEETELLKSHQIKHVVSMYPVSLPDFNQLYIDLYDTPSADIEQHFDTTYDFIDKHISNGEAVMVHCHAGRSRASTIVINYLMKKYNISFLKAYAYLKTKRPIIEPNDGFKMQLISSENGL